MSIVVEHEKRRHEILGKALEVFVDEGFGDVTYQKIADRCGVTRTTLYTYFKNKRDIFNYCIKQFLLTVDNNITEIYNDKLLSHAEKIIQVMTVTLKLLEENRPLLSVIKDYLVHSMKMKSDFDPDSRVRRRTIRLRRVITSLLMEGKKAGEFVQSINVKDANELLFSFLESASFRLVILNRKSVGDLIDAMRLTVNCFKSK